MAPPRLRSSYTPTEFAELVARENDQVELKTGTGNKPLQEALVALSNTDGGVIFLGVDDRRNVLGRTLDQGTDDAIHQAALDAYNVGRYEVQQVRVDTVLVVAIVVQRREEGIAQTSDGRILVRRGARNQPVFGDDVWQLSAARTLRRFERTSSGVRLDEVPTDRLVEFAERFGLSPDAADLPARLTERGLASGDHLTIAGALVVTDPAVALSSAKFSVELRWFRDTEGPDFHRRVTIGGPLPEQVRNAAATITEELGSDVVVTGIHRRDLPRLPIPVVREAIANAVAHRSYEQDQTSVLIEIRPDRLVVTSPGRLPGNVTVDTMREAQAARNPTVIGVLRRFGLTEDAGRGVDLMQDLMQDEMLDPPRFEEIGDFVRVTLPITGPVTTQERAWLKDLEERGTLRPADRLLLVHAARRTPETRTPATGGALFEEATVPQQLTNSSARRIAGLDRDEARAALRRLRDLGLLVQHGERGGAYYTLDRALIRGAAHGLTPEEVEQLVLSAAAERPIRNADVRRITGLDSPAAGVLLRRLAERGRLVRRGERRGTTYSTQ